jgi:molybdopterin-guanine dinucleotide biosynthesis protein A
MGVTGIILAGGKSTRMGTEKGLQELCGKPLINYAIDVLSGICSNIIISSSSEVYQSFGFRVVPDEFPSIGPMGGIYSALRQSGTQDNLVISCDLPFVSAELLKFILANSQGYEVAVPWEGNMHYEPLCGFYNKSVLEKIKAFIKTGNYKLPDLFEDIRINKLVIDKTLDFYTDSLFYNVNSKLNLHTAEEMMHRG